MLNITLKFRNDIYILLCVYLFIYLFIYLLLLHLERPSSFKNMLLHVIYIYFLV